MKIHVLGAGTCVNDLPVPGTQNQFPPGFFIQWGDGPFDHLMLECAEGVRFRLPQMGIPLESVRNIAISHAHPDHCALVHFLQSVSVRYMFGGRAYHIPELLVFAPNRLVDGWKSMWAMQVEELSGKSDLEWPRLNLCAATPGDAQTFRRFALSENHDSQRLDAFRVHHGSGKVDALGFRLLLPDGRTVAYSGDTGMCRGVRLLASRANVFICEIAARIGDAKMPYDYGHLTPGLAGQIAAEARVKHLILFHHAGLDTDSDIIADCRASGFGGELTLARDLTTIEV